MHASAVADLARLGVDLADWQGLHPHMHTLQWASRGRIITRARMQRLRLNMFEVQWPNVIICLPHDLLCIFFLLFLLGKELYSNKLLSEWFTFNLQYKLKVIITLDLCVCVCVCLEGWTIYFKEDLSHLDGNCSLYMYNKPWHNPNKSTTQYLCTRW